MERKWNSVTYFQYQTKHLFICGGNLVQEKTSKVDVNGSKILFEFSCRDNHKILECGVRLVSEEEESRKVGYFETGGSSDHYTDGEEGYEPKAVQVFQCENIKSNEETCWCWSWFGEEEEDEEEEEEEKTSVMIRR